jgi:uncharacterized lipoprotein YajG
MAGLHVLAADKLNADTAGLTSVDIATPTVAATSPTEYLSNVLHSDMGGLGFLFGHNASHNVNTNLEAPQITHTAQGGAQRAWHAIASKVEVPIEGITTDAVDKWAFTDTLRQVGAEWSQRFSTLRQNLGL